MGHTEALGRCDKKQYEHCGLHPCYSDVGQRLPPFGCVNWKPQPAIIESDSANRDAYCRQVHLENEHSYRIR